MRVAFIVLLLVLAGCAQQSPGTPTADDQVMPANFAGTVEYRNGSVPPPYHYEWRVRFDESTVAVEWRPGYDSATEPWRETADITDDQRKHLYASLRDLGVFGMTEPPEEGMVGGPSGSVEVTVGGHAYDSVTLGQNEDSVGLLKDIADAVIELFPAGVWDGLKAKQDDWSDQQPK